MRRRTIFLGGLIGGLTTPKGHNIWTGATKRPVVTPPLSDIKSSGIVNADDGLSLRAEGVSAKGGATAMPSDTPRPVVQGLDGQRGGNLNIQALDEVVINAKGSSSILNSTARQLQTKFKHASDFGVTGNWNKTAAGKFSSAINQHINAPGIKVIQGTYHKLPATHYLNHIAH